MIRVYFEDGKTAEIGPTARYSPAPEVDYGVEDITRIIIFEAGFEVDEGTLPREGQPDLKIRILRMTDPATGVRFEIPMTFEAAEAVGASLRGTPQVIVPGIVRP